MKVAFEREIPIYIQGGAPEDGGRLGVRRSFNTEHRTGTASPNPESRTPNDDVLIFPERIPRTTPGAALLTPNLSF